jgi:hypothetical protein
MIMTQISQLFDRVPRPKTRGAAVSIVLDVYRQNDWDEDAQRRHQLSLKLEAKQLTERTNDEIKTILDDFEKARMVIFKGDDL